MAVITPPAASENAGVTLIVDSAGAVVDLASSAAGAGGQGTTQKTVTQTSGANAAQTATIAAVAAKRNTIRKVVLFASAAANATLKLQEAAVDKVNFGTIALTTEAKVFDVLYTGAVNTALQVVVGAGGAGITTTVSVVADAA